MSSHYLDAPVVTVLRQVQALGWQQDGNLLHLSSSNTEHSHDVPSEVFQLAHLDFNPDIQNAVKLVDFQVCSDGIRHTVDYARKPDFSIMGMNIRFHIQTSEPVDLIMACTDKDWNPPVEVRVTHTFPTFVTRFYKKTLNPVLQSSSASSTQVIKIINAYAGQQFALYIVGVKSNSVKVEGIKVESYPIPIEVSTEAYHGQLMVVFDKLFDLESYNKQQAAYIIKYYNKIAKNIRQNFGLSQANAFLHYCQSKFCIDCQERARPNEGNDLMLSSIQIPQESIFTEPKEDHESLRTEHINRNFLSKANSLAALSVTNSVGSSFVDHPVSVVSRANSASHFLSKANSVNSKSWTENNSIGYGNAQESTSQLNQCMVNSEASKDVVVDPRPSTSMGTKLHELQYCFHLKCIPRLVHKGDYRTILDDDFVKVLINDNNLKLEMKEMMTTQKRLRGQKRAKSAKTKTSQSMDEMPTFNIVKWHYRDKVIEKKKHKVELGVEEQLYKDSGEMYKRICPKCKMVEPFLDARFHRLLEIAEEEKKKKCLLKGENFVKSEYKAKCIKCRVPFEPRITWNAEIWENKTNNFVTGKIIRRETLANIFADEIKNEKWKITTFNNSPQPNAKISLMQKELTDEGFRHIFKKKKSKHRKVKIIPEPITIPDVSSGQLYNSKEVCTPNSKVSVSSGFFVTSTGEMVFFDDEVDDDDEEEEKTEGHLFQINESEEIQESVEDLHIQSKLSVQLSSSESISEADGIKSMSLVLEKLKLAVTLDRQLSDLPEELLVGESRPTSASKRSGNNSARRQQPLPVFIPPF